MKRYLITLAALALTFQVSAVGTNSTFAPARGRPKVAVLRFENVSPTNSSSIVINPALTPVFAGVIAREQSDSQIKFTSAKQEVERYSEQARSLLERELATWPEIEVLDRSRLDVLDRERQLNTARGGNRSQAERPYYQHGVDYLVLGQILDLWSAGSEFLGYGLHHQARGTHALLYIRVISVATEQEVYAVQTTGAIEQLVTQFSATLHSDPPSAAIREAIRVLIADQSFKQEFVGKVKLASTESANSGDPVEVVFKPTPRRTSVELDGNYIGESPLKRQLTVGAKHTIRLKHPGFPVWESTIVVERNMVVAPDIGAATGRDANER